MNTKKVIELLTKEDIKVLEENGCLYEQVDDQEYYAILKKEDDWKFYKKSRGNENLKEVFKTETDAVTFFFLYEIKHKKIDNAMLAIKRENNELLQGNQGIDGVIELFGNCNISNDFYNNEVGYSVNIEKKDELFNIYVVNPNKEKIYESKKLLSEKDLCLILFYWTFSISAFCNIYSKYLESGILKRELQDTDVIFMINPCV